MEYWNEVDNIDLNRIILGDGSIPLIYKANKLFIDDMSKVLGYSPQFSDYIDDVKVSGGIYDYYSMETSESFKFKLEKYLNKMSKDYKIFYIDNPNNPTGQVIDITSIKEIVKKGKNLNRPVIVDEAYGDFIDKKNSAISLMNKYDNLIVIRTFSKGLGLAGIRAGYLVTSKLFADPFSKVGNPFELNSIARYLAIAAMKDEEFMNFSKAHIKSYKQRFMDSLKKLKILETDVSVPIMTLIHLNHNVDLEALLFKHQIISIPGQSFIGLDKNSVRVIISKDIDALITAFNKAESEIS